MYVRACGVFWGPSVSWQRTGLFLGRTQIGMFANTQLSTVRLSTPFSYKNATISREKRIDTPRASFFRLIRFVRIIRFVRFSFPSSDGPGGDRALRPLPGDRFAPRLHGAVRLHLRIPDRILPLHDLILLRVIP